MSHRSPTRFLAPLVLVAALVTIYLVARPELRGTPKAAPAASSPAKAAKPGTKAARSGSGKAAAKGGAVKAKAGTYVVKPGDVLGSISESTGVSVADLQSFNKIDAQNLRVGQKLKLRP